MPKRNEGWIWAGRVLAVVILLALGIYLWRTGLDRANEVSGGLILLVAVATLFAPYVLKEPASEREPAQVASKIIVGGRVIQVRDSQGVTLGRGTSASPPPPVAPEGAGRSDQAGGRQIVRDAWIGQDLAQIDGARDVSME